ncbi:hypothetical protein CPLU01_03398 [Colletotrichum plurivorum]|uniref:Uncharacterized protein n=1 Tax=Colletotrichum plurivorum TaxID=2175906 RepID=A0A8H6KSF9_9PEZI|nr:hypothetical protein CPLU01_03398 [Colletotrichum plurivorum]
MPHARAIDLTEPKPASGRANPEPAFHTPVPDGSDGQHFPLLLLLAPLPTHAIRESSNSTPDRHSPPAVLVPAPLRSRRSRCKAGGTPSFNYRHQPP